MAHNLESLILEREYEIIIILSVRYMWWLWEEYLYLKCLVYSFGYVPCEICELLVEGIIYSFFILDVNCDINVRTIEITECGVCDIWIINNWNQAWWRNSLDRSIEKTHWMIPKAGLFVFCFQFFYRDIILIFMFNSNVPFVIRFLGFLFNEKKGKLFNLLDFDELYWECILIFKWASQA